ncbi:MAG: site-2 protease family protein, partial [Acidobacteriota bacterium]
MTADHELPAPPSAPALLPARLPGDRLRLHLLCLAATVVATTYFGGWHYVAFLADFESSPADPGRLTFWLHGLWFSLSVLAILGAHEWGHYAACRFYKVDASLPFFLPAPLPLTGTFGAFIRIRDVIPHKRALFDIGASGPFAGFVVAV